VPETAGDVRAGCCDYLYLVLREPIEPPTPEQPLLATEPGILKDDYVNVFFSDGRVKGYYSLPESIANLIALCNESSSRAAATPEDTIR